MTHMERERTQTSPQTRTRPRRLRVAAAALATLVTLVAVMGAANVLPVDATPEAAFAGTLGAQADSAAHANGSAISLSAMVSASLPRHPGLRRPAARRPPVPRLAERSGQGKRIVFDIGDQRVWLVSARHKVLRTYLVSGSLTDNLGPGTYQVYSKSRHAIGIDDSGTMGYMVRFTQGQNAAIGFHDIPVHEGEQVQTRRELGTPQSHGCIRQLSKDAKALWDFAPVGTTVVVLA